MENNIIEKIYNKENEIVNTFTGKGAMINLLNYCFDKAICNIKSYKMNSKILYNDNGESYSIITIKFDNGYKYIWENVKTDSCGRIETPYISKILNEEK